ncbi:MAG: cell division protein ZapA [Clostridia bacterium]|nr:cell division protein ZapA [Clostridia bacterium]
MEKIKVTIAGESYSLTTDDDLDYMENLAADVDAKIKSYLQMSSRISVTQAAVLTVLEYADLYKKSDSTCENLRTQIQAYLEDAARSRTDAELAKREVEKLKKELNTIKGTK